MPSFAISITFLSVLSFLGHSPMVFLAIVLTFPFLSKHYAINYVLYKHNTMLFLHFKIFVTYYRLEASSIHPKAL